MKGTGTSAQAANAQSIAATIDDAVEDSAQVVAAAASGVVSGIAGPATAWTAKLPEAIPQVQQKLAFLARPIGTVQWMMEQLQGVTGSGVSTVPQAPPVHSINILGILFSGTATVAAGLFTTLVVLFYLLVAGETFLRRFVEILPGFAEKRQAVELTLNIERNISAYLVTVTLINGVVGLSTLCVMWACGVANPLLWGVLAFVLNFVPMLAITKIVCDDLRPLRAFGHFPEG